MKVKILKSNNPASWYSYDELIGDVFEVVDRGKDYVLKEDYDRGHDAIWRHIEKHDCEVVEISREEVEKIVREVAQNHDLDDPTKHMGISAKKEFDKAMKRELEKYKNQSHE